ncbi:hypothetical protein, partial [Streptomyces sp. GbtcB7]|uniref:hypothetical protein n=1 Tax=Streptomyces sp. GbtcB7 TaxID=2824752 RepID=UPI001C30C3BC
SGVTRQQLLLLHAARVTTANSTRKEPGPDLDTVRDLTGAVTAGTLTWIAPDDGSWVIASYWVRGSGQSPEGGPHTAPA